MVKYSRRLWIAAIVCLMLVVAQSAMAKTTLTVLVHGDFNASTLDEFMAEYSRLNPDIVFEKQVVPFDDLLTKVQISALSGQAPDIMHLYSLWGVELSRSGIIDAPPAYIVDDVKNNYTPVAVNGVTIDGQIWGIPTEINNYALIYNNRIFEASGYAAPPQTWDELVEAAKKMTVYDGQRNISQYGYTFLVGWDSAVVHPYLSLLWSNGGDFLSPDGKQFIANQPAGIEALEQQLRLFNEGGSDVNGSVWDFPNGNIAMMTMFPAMKGMLRDNMGDRFFTDVRVAPIPRLKTHVTALYTWFATVSKSSPNKEEAWKFLHWLTAQTQPGKGSTRMGDHLVESIGALPSRLDDIENHPEALNDHFSSVYVSELQYSRAEPLIARGAEIKTTLMNEIVEAWYGRKSAKDALDAAARQINSLLAR